MHIHKSHSANNVRERELQNLMIYPTMGISGAKAVICSYLIHCPLIRTNPCCLKSLRKCGISFKIFAFEDLG